VVIDRLGVVRVDIFGILSFEYEADRVDRYDVWVQRMVRWGWRRYLKRGVDKANALTRWRMVVRISQTWDFPQKRPLARCDAFLLGGDMFGRLCNLQYFCHSTW
jgi:hypothetical protein